MPFWYSILKFSHFLWSLIHTPLLPNCCALPTDPALALFLHPRRLCSNALSCSLYQLTPHSSFLSQPRGPQGRVPDLETLRGALLWSMIVTSTRHPSNCLLPAGTMSFLFTPVSPAFQNGAKYTTCRLRLLCGTSERIDRALNTLDFLLHWWPAINF